MDSAHARLLYQPSADHTSNDLTHVLDGPSSALLKGGAVRSRPNLAADGPQHFSLNSANVLMSGGQGVNQSIPEACASFAELGELFIRRPSAGGITVPA